ncbi:Sensor protein torS [Delftia tsuruhatensis]|uniref:ATP-binding response regulator n=1 Tax=Delftia tsuruhatensis TaxID=180282 RepID=UPI001E73A955|nr:hybrid sensor histidine kinase/response regulator [Delftia tsuruhatensis]CAB5715028.1 Sensor protein torS [Delftia tsuruhatensis]CAC9676630.1 Sensor protein torS [Delftia tsuruhatensis]
MAISSEPQGGSGGPLWRLQQRQRLLLSIASRGSSEVAALVIPGVLVWLQRRETGVFQVPLLLWWLGMALIACVFVVLRRRLRRDLCTAVPVPSQLYVQLALWERMMGRMALLNAGAWALVIPLTHAGDHELRLFIYLVLCAVVASAAMFLAPAAALFWRFFAVLFGAMLLAVAWYFPHRGPYLLALLMLYGAIIVRHAWGARQLMLQQWTQERERQLLAERYLAAKEQAEQALEAKSRFLAAASHDLRQPLHALGLLVETARQRNADGALARVLDDAQACAHSLGTMCNDLLDLSRLESGGWELRMQVVDLGILLGDAARLFAAEAGQRGLALRWRVARGMASHVRVDEALMRQMVFNLLHNALRYTPQGGVLLAARVRAGGWRIEVWDTGLGIAAEDRPHVFAPHFRARTGWEARRGAPPGVTSQGLGLAVVAAAARRMGLEHGLLSTPGRGSCFWLQLPPSLNVRHEPTPARVAGAEPQRPALQGLCWVVDGDAPAAQALAGLLRDWGLQVEVADSGRQVDAWQRAGRHPDFMLCGHRLAGGEDGFVLLQSALAKAPRAAGALLSAEPSPALLEQAQELGYLLLRKPVAPQALLAVLQRSLSGAGG